MSKMNSILDEMQQSQVGCLEMYHSLKNKDELSGPCKEVLSALYSERGVQENNPINIYGGNRSPGGVSHAALQRRFTGKMSGVSLSA